MSTNTYNIQDSVMSVNEWITETFGEFNAEGYNKLPENITGHNMATVSYTHLTLPTNREV